MTEQQGPPPSDAEGTTADEVPATEYPPTPETPGGEPVEEEAEEKEDEAEAEPEAPSAS